MSRKMSAGTPTDDDPAMRIEPASRPPSWLLRVVNPVLALVLRSRLHGLASDRLALLTVTGRTTGTEYTFPVLYEREGDTVKITSHGTTWWKNLRDGGQDVTIYLEGRRRTGHAEVEEADRPVAEHVHGYLQRHGADTAGRVGLALPGGEIPPVETLASAVDHVVLVTVELSDA